MTLVHRMSVFFLAILAIVLAGLSICIHIVAHEYLIERDDETLNDALVVLTAAAEQLENGVEWEPYERQVGIGLDPSNDQPRWTVRDADLSIVDHSINLGTHSPLLEESIKEKADVESWAQEYDGTLWHFRSRWVHPTGIGAPTEPHLKTYDRLLLTVGLNLEPTARTLRNLTLTLTGLSLGIWLFAAGFGTWAMQRALRPLTAMADGSRAIAGTDLSARIPDPQTGDELADLAKAFNDLLSRAQESLQRQQRFSSDASHQLRTPLTSMIGHIDVALRRERTSEEYLRVLRLVRQNAAHLNMIVDSLLFLARADREFPLSEKKRTELNSWTEEQLVRWQTHPRIGDIRRSLAAEPIYVSVHQNLLGQLFDNLLDNAIKYSEPGSAITIATRSDGTEGELVVSDTGIGIREQDIPRLFEPFYRGAATVKSVRSGVGLGLSVVKRIADGMGAGVRVESAVNKGSRFIVSIPLSDANQSTMSELTEPVAQA